MRKMRLNIQLFASGAIEFDNWTSGSAIRGKIEWSSEVDGSTASEKSNRNRSIVTANMYVRRSSGGETTRGREWSGYLDTGGDRYDFYETQDGSSISVGTSWVYVDRYITYVNHNADGTKNVYLSGEITGPSGTTLAGKSSWGGATVTLDTIPRMSPITSVTSGTTNYAPVVKWTPYSSEFKYKVAYSYGNWSSGQSALISPGSTSEQTYNGITINGDDVAPYMTDRETATFTATLYTYASDGTTLIGSTTKTFEVTLNASYVPTASIGTITDAGGLVPSSWGILVAGKSKLAFAVTGTPSLGSTISGYTSIVEGRTYTGSNVTTNFVTESGTVNSYVTDSRGRNSEMVVRNYTVYPYSSPVITTAVAERCLADGTLSDQGTYVKYSFSAAVSSCDGHNTGTYQLGYRVHDTGNYTYMTITNGATDVIIPGVQFNAQTSYDIQFLASDTFTTTPVVITLIVYEGFRLVHYNKNHKALAVGKMSTATGNTKLLEIALPTNITDEVSVDGDPSVANFVYDDVSSSGTNRIVQMKDTNNNNVYPVTQGGGLTPSDLLTYIYPVGSIYMSTVNISPQTFLGGNWEQIQNRFLLSAGSSYTAGDTGGEATHTLTINEMPSHSHQLDRGNYGNSRLEEIAYSNGSSTATGSWGVHNTGGGQAHNNMPPYLVVYMWKRIPD